MSGAYSHVDRVAFVEQIGLNRGSGNHDHSSQRQRYVLVVASDLASTTLSNQHRPAQIDRTDGIVKRLHCEGGASVRRVPGAIAPTSAREPAGRV